MGQKLGMDPEVIRAVGLKLRAQERTLAAAVHAIDVLVEQGRQVWMGPSSAAFADRWYGGMRAQLAAAEQAISGLATSAARQADQQQQVSSTAGAGGGTSGGGTSGAGGGGGGGYLSRAVTREDVDRLIALVRTGAVDVPGLVLDTVNQLKTWGWPNPEELVKHLGSTKLNSLGEVVHGWGTAGGALSLIGMGWDAAELGTALAESDEPEAWRNGVDVAAGLATSFVPGGGLAWAAGTVIGESIYDGVTQVYDWEGATQDFARREMFGDSYDPDSPAQAAALVQRYEGPMGIANSISDHMVGASNSMVAAGEDAFGDAYEASLPMLRDTSEAARDAGVAVADSIRQTRDVLTGMRLPWQR